MPLRNKVALVTGSTSGIGRGIAEALSAEGVSVMLNGFGDPAQIAELQAGLPTPSGYCDANVSRPAEIREMVARAERDFGSVDILVNNAGIQVTAPLEAFPDEAWDRILAINLSAAFHATKAAIPAMKQRGWGRIINVASAHGLVASPDKVGYVAAKHGLLGMTKVAALELANTGVTCNAICPGWVLTPLVEQQLRTRAEREDLPFEEVKRRLLSEKQPLTEFTTPTQIGALAVFLCSEAARTITGAPLSIDGGWTAQ